MEDRNFSVKIEGVDPTPPPIRLTFSLDFTVEELREWKSEHMLHLNVAKTFSNTIMNFPLEQEPLYDSLRGKI